MIHGVADFVTRCYFRPSLNISRPRETTRRRSRRKKCRRDISKGWHELISWAAGPNQLLPDSFLRRCCAVSRPPAVSPFLFEGGGEQHGGESISNFLIFLIFSHLQPFHLCHLLPIPFWCGGARAGGTMGNGRRRRRRRGMARNNNTTHVIFHP